MTNTIDIRPNDLFAKIDEIAPLIRENALEAERQRRLSPEVAEALRDAGLFRMFRPQSRGGFELDPVTAFRLIEAVSRIDGATGWNVGISNASEPFGAWLSDAASEEVFRTRETVLAGAFNPPRKATVVDGGYRLTGRTPFNSNCHSATWFIGLAHVHDGDEPRLDELGNPVTLVTFVPSHEGQIIENWETLGLGGTGSHDIEISDVFVPNERAPLFVPLEKPSRAYSGPFHRVSVWSGIACIAVPALGIAQSAIDDLVALARKVPAYTDRSLRDRAVVQQQLARAEGSSRRREPYSTRPTTISGSKPSKVGLWRQSTAPAASWPRPMLSSLPPRRSTSFTPQQARPASATSTGSRNTSATPMSSPSMLS